MATPSFIFGQSTKYKTPEQLQEARRRVRELMSGGPDQYSRPGGWLYALGDGLGAALEQRRINQGEQYAEEQRQKGNSLFSQLMTGGAAYPSSVASGGSPTSAAATATTAPLAGTETVNLSGDKKKFIDTLLPAAIEHGQRIGVDPRIIVAQAAQETGWGRAAPGNNFFGIKSHGQGGGQNLTTHEVINGQRVKINDSFRTFASPQDSVAGYADFIGSNKRYRPMREAQGLDAQLQALGASGYATDPNYARSVGAIARSINLPQQNVDYTATNSIPAPTPQAAIQAVSPVADPEGLFAPGADVSAADLEFARQATGQEVQPAQSNNFNERWNAGSVAPQSPSASQYTPGQVVTGADGNTYQNVEQPDGSFALSAYNPNAQQPTASPEMLRQNDLMWGGALAPQGQAPQQQARVQGYFPEAPSMDRAPIQPQAQQFQNAGRAQALAELLSNPFVPDEQKRVAQMMLQQEMQLAQQAADPLRQLQMQKIQADIVKTRRGEDETFFGNVIKGYDEKGNPTYYQTGNKGGFKRVALPEGFRPENRLEKVDLGTHWLVKDTTTGEERTIPKENYQEAFDKGAGAADGKAKSDAKSALPGLQSQVEQMSTKIDDVINDPNLSGSVGNVWGRLPSYSQGAIDFDKKVEQIKGQVFLQARQFLKGQGPITDYESARAEAAMAQLDQAQSEAQFKAALTELKSAIQSGFEKARLSAGGQLTAPVPSATGGQINTDIPGVVIRRKN